MNSLNIPLPKHLSYLILDQNYLVLKTSPDKINCNCFSNIIGKDVRDSFPELIGFEDILSQTLQGQESFELLGVRRETATGLAIYLDIYIVPHQINTELIIFIEDVTEKMSLEQTLVQATNEMSLLLSTLEANKDYINKLIASVADAFLVTSTSGKIKKVNQAAQALFDYREDELVNQYLDKIVSNSNLLIPNGSSEERLDNLEVVCTTKTGKKLTVAFSCAAIQSEIKELQELIYVGRDITKRKRSQQRLATQYATTNILSESTDLEQAILKILQAIEENLGWDIGELWMLKESTLSEVELTNEPSLLKRVAVYPRSPEDVIEFINITQLVGLPVGVGLAGRVWATLSPRWITNLIDDVDFGKRSFAVKVGLHSAFGVPIQSDGERLGVITFFSHDEQLIDTDMLQMMVAIGGQLGQFVKRRQAEQDLKIEREKAETLLLNILPEPIANRLKHSSDTIAEDFSDVTVLFADLVDFTQLSSQRSSTELVEILNVIFSEFDQLAERHGLEKIKTIGDAYMVVGGIPLPKANHVEAIAEIALDMQSAIAQFNAETGQSFNIRIGISTGAVVAGVIGIKKFAYDLWGDTVNTASRMESHGISGKIQVPEETYRRLKDRYLFEERGLISIKGKGEMRTYLLTGRLTS